MKLTVLLFCYNQEMFIEQAIESVLNQKIDFEFQLVIADDGSTDNTMNIVNDYAKRFPTIITPLTSSKAGIFENVFRTENAIKGEYIALLDGDDYWKFEGKLQQQVNFLEGNEDYVACFHDAEILHIGKLKNNYFELKKQYSQNYFYQSTIYPVDILKRLIIPTASVVFRRKALTHVLTKKQLLGNFYSLDWKIYCLLIAHSKFYYFNETWSVYRNHAQGVSKKNTIDFHLSNIQFLNALLTDDFYKDYKYYIYKAISHEFVVILDSCDGVNKRKLFRKYLINELKRLWWYRKELKNK